MENKNDETLDIVKLIEKSPITRLSKDYQNALIIKIKKNFTDKEQQMFVGSFYCYLNYSKTDHVIDLDQVWKWVGFTRKDHAKIVIEKNFVEDVDYKIVFPQGRENIKGGRPKEQCLMTIKTFKRFCLKAGTKKAGEIHEYYINLEELLHETINEQTDDFKNQLTIKDKQLISKDKQHKLDLKMKRHNILIELLKTKKCVYLGEIGKVIETKKDEEDEEDENEFFKIGSSYEIDVRSKALNLEYRSMTFLEAFECVNFREVEANILADPIIIKNLYRKSIKIDGSISNEVVKLSKNFNYDQLLAVIKKHVANDHSIFLTPLQLLEKQKLDIEQQRINMENRKMDIEQQKIDLGILPSVSNNDKYLNEILKIVKNSFMSVNNESSKEKRVIKDDQPKGQKKNKTNNPNNQIIVDVKRDIKLSRGGRKVRKIDKDDITKVIKVYDSSMSLLRSSENSHLKTWALENAIKNNTVYDGYRWNFVEKGEDPNISNTVPTTILKKNPKVGTVLQLNETKTKILRSFFTKIQLSTELKINKPKLNKIIENDVKHNGHYYVLIQNCPKNLLEDYNGSTVRIVNTKLIKQINPITKEEIIFNSITEISVKLGFSQKSIRKAIRTNIMYGGSMWKYVKNENGNDKKEDNDDDEDGEDEDGEDEDEEYDEDDEPKK